jgi:hypothetical protein
MLAFLDELRSCGKGTTACQIASQASPDNSKVDPEEMDFEVVTIEELSDKMKAVGLEVNPGAREAIVEQQELCEQLRRHRGPKKRTQESVGSRQKLAATRKRLKRHAVPAL